MNELEMQINLEWDVIRNRVDNKENACKIQLVNICSIEEDGNFEKCRYFKPGRDNCCFRMEYGFLTLCVNEEAHMGE